MADAPPHQNNKQHDAPSPTGLGIIAAKVKLLPTSSGVYQMLDTKDRVLYVGKARNLRARVAHYTRYQSNSVRIQRMIAATASMTFVTTDTEAEALLLENNLIKRFKPKYNVLLRDDKSFPYILISSDHEAPDIQKHRGAREKNGTYFGPFASAVSVNRTISTLQKAFLLRNCTDAFYAGRSRPCLQYQIKRCAAPCTGEISLQAYGGLVQQAKDFLAGKSAHVQKSLAQQMQQAADKMDFERAALLRDRLSALALIQSQSDISAQTLAEADIFALHEQGGQFCVQVFFFRAYQNWGNHAYFPRADKEQSASDILTAFIAQFYDKRIAPKLVLTSHLLDDQDVLQEALSLKAKHKIEIAHPKRGEKRDLVCHASQNARSALEQRLNDRRSELGHLKKLQETLELNYLPARIEIYDNSHIQGTNAVGAMVVSGRQGLAKKNYRTFNIKSTDITPGDDFGMMREVLTRRFTRLLKETEQPTQFGDIEDDLLPEWPDILLIDGGKGQLNTAQQVLTALGVTAPITLVGVAKGVDRHAGKETFYFIDKQPVNLDQRDPVLFFVQRLRDEAHRFAIGTHRAKRKKQTMTNPLDEVEGVGPARKRALLNHFGSAKAVSRASLEDLKRTDGISHQMAQIIFDHFREQ